MLKNREVKPSNIGRILASADRSSSKIYKFIFVDESVENGDIINVYYVRKSDVERWADKNLDEYVAIDLIDALEGSHEYDNETIDQFVDAIQDHEINVVMVKKAKVKFDSYGDLVHPVNIVALYPTAGYPVLEPDL